MPMFGGLRIWGVAAAIVVASYGVNADAAGFKLGAVRADPGSHVSPDLTKHAVYGDIGKKYTLLGGEKGPLGAPLTDEADAPFGGRFNQFVNGYIYWHKDSGANAVYGDIAKKWMALGGVNFGYPYTDEKPTRDDRGRYNDFIALQRPDKPLASVYWTPQTGAHALYGAIRKRWLDLGGEKGLLGYPTNEEVQDGDRRRVDFEHGAIWWAPGDKFGFSGDLAAVGACSQLFRAWRRGNDNQELKLEACQDINGLNSYCAAHDGYVAIYYVPATTNRYLDCHSNYHPDSVGDQFDHLTRGISQGVADAFVAAAPFVGPTISGAACSTGVIYACAVFALDVADLAGAKVAGIAADALEAGKYAGDCASLDFVACARLGVRGLGTAAGYYIPGADPDAMAATGQSCRDGDFNACASLGKTAADAAGLPPGLGPPTLANAQDCLARNAQACAALGKEASQPGVPLGGLANAAQLAPACAGGEANSCSRLGEVIVGLKLTNLGVMRSGGHINVRAATQRVLTPSSAIQH